MKKQLSWAVAFFVLIIISQAPQSGAPVKAAGVDPVAQALHAPQTPPLPGGVLRQPAAKPGSEVKAAADYGRMELRFVLNDGQLDETVAYYVQGRDKSVYFRPDGLTFVLSESAKPDRPPLIHVVCIGDTTPHGRPTFHCRHSHRDHRDGLPAPRRG